MSDLTVEKIKALVAQGEGVSYALRYKMFVVLLSQLDELERKAFQLCYLSGSMMLACKQLAEVQHNHSIYAVRPCQCAACAITLPDFSDEAINKLTEESNAAFSARAALGSGEADG